MSLRPIDVPRPVAVVLATCTLLIAAGSMFATPAAPAAKSSGGKADRTIPSVAIAAPSAGATVSSTITVSGSAADNASLARVEVGVDGGAYRAATGTSSWTIAIDTKAYGNGAHTVTARAIDSAGNASASSVSVEVSNTAATDTTPPVVNISSPAAGADVARQFAASGTASDDTGVAKVEVRIDGGTWRLADGTSFWSATIDASTASDGQHQVTARATDAAGNVASASVSVQIGDQPITSPELSAGMLGGFVFQEQDRDGVFESGEQPLGGMYVYLYNSTGTYVGKALTDSTGWYRFSALADATYRAALAPTSWNALDDDWVSTTTGTIFPSATVELAGSARADFGTRPIVRSTDASAPISTYVGPSGLTVKSYDDAVTAREVHDRLMSGALAGGAEASYVTVRFDFAQAGLTSTMAVQSNGQYVDFKATSDITWTGWLRGDGELFHEYGHAWSRYYSYMVQGDPSMRAYLQARGLEGDPRIGSTYPWRVGEMIAEDYRQLFGTVSARADAQLNRDIPLAKDVPGLAAFLSGAFMQTRVP